MTRALVFAGSSFVGKHLCKLLREKNVDVITTARRPADARTIACDLTCRADVAAAIEQTHPDWIIQCGAATASSAPRDQYAVHVTGALNVLKAAHEFASAASILFFGSAAEYGVVPPEDLPVPETYPCHPTSFFGASKLAQTQLAQAAAATHGQRITIVRPFNIIGPGLPDHYFAAALAKRLLKQNAALEAGLTTDRTFEVHNPHATRDFIDVQDVSSAVYFILDQPPPEPGQAALFNIATGVETSILEVARHLCTQAGNLTPQPAGQADSRADIVRSSGDPVALTDSGWEAVIPWRASLNSLWQEALRAIPALDRVA